MAFRYNSLETIISRGGLSSRKNLNAQVERIGKHYNIPNVIDITENNKYFAKMVVTIFFMERDYYLDNLPCRGKLSPRTALKRRTKDIRNYLVCIRAITRGNFRSLLSIYPYISRVTK